MMSPYRIAAALFVVALVPGSARAQAVPTDAAGDPLPPGAVARIGTVRFLPRPYLEQVFFTPDGATVIGRGADNVLDFWEATTGKPVGEFREPDLMNFWADQSPDGKLLALYGHDRRGKPAPDTALRLYELATRKPLWTSVIDDLYHPGYHRVRFSMDGKKLITGSGLDVRVWDAKSGKELARQNVRVGYPGLALSPDGKTLVVGSEPERCLYLWEWESGDLPRKVSVGAARYFSSLAFSPDGKMVYTSDSDRQAYGYDVATGNFVGKADPSVLRWRAVSPDGKTIATADFDKAKQEGSVVLRDAASGKEVGRLRSGKFMIVNGCWSKDGSRLAGVAAFRAWVWDVKTGKPFGPDVPGHTAGLTSLSFKTDGQLITSSDDSTIRAWDSATGKELWALRTERLVWGGTVLSPDGDLLAGSSEPNAVRVWAASAGKEVFKLAWGTGRTGGVYKVRFTADEQTLLTYGSDFYLRAWDTLTGKLKSERRVRPAAFGPETGDDWPNARDVYLSNRAIDLTPDGNTLVIGIGKEVTAYSADTGKERFKFEADPRYLQALVLSPDGTRLAVAGYGQPPAIAMMARPTHYPVSVWDMAQAKRLAQFSVPGTSGCRVLAFTPDGKQVVTGSWDEVLRFWDAATGAATGVIDLPRPAARLAFGGGKRLAVGFSDPTVLVYDLAAALKPAKKE
jgi:WD40 repeat protein